MTSCDDEIKRYFTLDVASALFAIVLFCCTRNCTSNDPEIGGIVLIVSGISQVIAGALLATVFYPSDCINFWDVPYGYVVAIIGFCWIMRGFGLLLGGNNDDNDLRGRLRQQAEADEQERINRMNDDDESCIPQSLILNDKIKREERRRSSVRNGSGIYGDRSPLEIGRQASDPLLQSAEAEEEMPITWDVETGERLVNEDTNLEVKQAEENLARAQEALHKAKLKESELV